MEHHAVQPRHPAGEGRLAVLVPEELRIPEPGAQHALVTGDDRAVFVGGQVGDDHEARREPALGILERQVFLVLAHRGDQDLLRQIHEALLDPAEQRHRPLDQARQLTEQARIVADTQPHLMRQPVRLGRDLAVALGAVDLDEGRLELVSVVLEAGDLDRRRCQEAMTVGDRTGSDRPEGQRHDLAVEQADDAVQRPHPAHRVVRPAHRLRPRKAAQDLWQKRPEHGAGWLTEACKAGDMHSALLVVLLLQAIIVDPERPQETVERLLRRADPRPASFDLDVRLARHQTAHHQDQPARRAVGRKVLVSQLGLIERGADQLAETGGGTPLHARRNLLRQELQQQLGHGGYAASAVWPRPRSQASQQARARARTRPI